MPSRLQTPTIAKPKTESANEILLRRRKKVILPLSANSGQALDPKYVATVAAEVEALGYSLSDELAATLSGLTLDELVATNTEILTTLTKALGAHHQFKPLYPNFPQQVVEASRLSLYVNALLHYLTDGKFFPNTAKKERPKLDEKSKLKELGVGSKTELESIFKALVTANSSLSEQDKADLTWFFKTYGDDILQLLPEQIPQRENKAHIIANLLRYSTLKENALKSCSSTTDVLRVAVALSDGDLSLAESTRFTSFARPLRKALLQAIEAQQNQIEDMLRWKKRWLRLGERLHPGEFEKQFPKAAAAFKTIRNDLPAPTFYRQLEYSLERGQTDKILSLVKQRPGEFTRRLDHILRISPTQQEEIALSFSSYAENVSTPVLLQVMQHFKTRCEKRELRVFLPKGQVQKAQAIPNILPSLSPAICSLVESICRKTLIARFSKQRLLGKCYLDPYLQMYMLPSSQRSAAKTLRTVARGSRLLLPDTDTLRFFIWWKNGNQRTDIDLSAALFRADFTYADTLAYYNLKNFGGCHSGDIVDAPLGASEFIDVSIEKLRSFNVAYIVMVVTSFTQQPYCDLPECFAGWMARKQANSGEIYEPKTVQDKLDLSGNTKISIPVIFDLKNREAIWTDISLTRNPNWYNNVAGNLGGIQISLKAFAELNKMSLFDLLKMHIEARGELVELPQDADVEFSVSAGTPYELERIASEFMA